jgi:AbrB family looped-hinge helix DNA binding protein
VNEWCHHASMSDTNSVIVGPKGRVVIPAPVRHQLGITEGSELVALVDDGGVLLLPQSEVKRRLRGMFAGVMTSMADELVADRTQEARREDRGG